MTPICYVFRVQVSPFHTLPHTATSCLVPRHEANKRVRGTGSLILTTHQNQHRHGPGSCSIPCAASQSRGQHPACSVIHAQRTPQGGCFHSPRDTHPTCLGSTTLPSCPHIRVWATQPRGLPTAPDRMGRYQ